MAKSAAGDAEYSVYVLMCSDGSLYTGIARDVERRFEQHKEGTGSKYVRSRLPCSLVYEERVSGRSVAQQREAEIKSWTRNEKISRLEIRT